MSHSPLPDLERDWKFFEQRGPPNLEEIGLKARDEVALFLEGKNHLRSKVACVTSGGTAVPLERTAVRYIENFSRGTRGARSCEQLLDENYSVILIVRDNAEKPFETLIEEENWLELLDKKNSKDISFKKRHEQHVKEIKTKYNHAKAQKKLLVLQYSTIFEFLKLLTTVASEMSHLGDKALFYYAAAVSDFYIPWVDLEENKIQSSESLSLHLSQVPKLLGLLKSYWAPQAFHISFKLETDSRLLLQNAQNAFMKYNVDMVIANELATRKTKVTVVTNEGDETNPQIKYEELVHDLKCRHIEEQIIRRVAIEHKKHMGEQVEDENLIMQEGMKGIEARNKMEAARKKRKLGILAYDEETGKMLPRNKRGGRTGLDADQPSKPLRAKTAYIFFCEDKRGQVKVEKPGLNMTDVTKTLGVMWKELPMEEKAEYISKGQMDRDRWEKENNEYLEELRNKIAHIPAHPERETGFI